ncbi:MAG TPA: DUF2330 domain-containing protein [Ktedonobacteraceae bacterium]|jgi:hypothetical protein|nr:DUF2330 domain-containing protein [Ktedonobacteraceae bacterium]
MIKRLAILVSALAFFVLQSQSALACGGLIAPDGDVRLARASTLVAWHNGIEHYLTSFTYQGSESDIGWIVPLPAVPMKIEEGGAWTLQRLAIETHPQPAVPINAVASAGATAQVLQQVKIEALNITVIRGSGQAVVNWATSNGFFLNGDTRDHLLTYAKGSPIFMAAKYDTAAAKARGQLEGDGVPILITMKTPNLWVPLEVLALDGQQVQADIYLLTDGPVNTSDVGAKVGQSAVGTEVPGAPGLKVAFQEQMTPTLYHDLSTDRNMSWVPSNGWLTYLSLDAPDTSVTYDMGVGTSGVIRIAHFGTLPAQVVAGPQSNALLGWLPTLPMGTPQFAETLLIMLGIIVALILIFRARTRYLAKRA